MNARPSRRLQRISWCARSATAVLLAACAEHERLEWCAAPPDAVVSLATTPTRWAEPPRLVPLWEYGGADDGRALGNPQAVVVHAATGTVAIADHATATIHVVARDGQPLGVHERSDAGDGPRDVDAMDWTADGRVAVLDARSGATFVLATDGTVVARRPLDRRLPHRWGRGGSVALQDPAIVVRIAAAGVVQEYPEPVQPQPWRDLHVLVFERGSQGPDTLLGARVRVTATDHDALLPGAPVPLVAALGDRLLVVAGDVAEHRIRVMDHRGTVVRQICRVAEALPLSPAESLAVVDAGELLPAERRARIGHLFASTDGRIWAQRERAAGPLIADWWHGPPGGTFDVYERDGAYLGVVRAPGDVRLVAARGDTVYGLRGWTGVDALVAFRLEGAPSVSSRRSATAGGAPAG